MDADRAGSARFRDAGCLRINASDRRFNHPEAKRHTEATDPLPVNDPSLVPK